MADAKQSNGQQVPPYMVSHAAIIFMSTSTFPYLQLSFILSTSLICGRADSESPLSLQSCNKLRFQSTPFMTISSTSTHFTLTNLTFNMSARQLLTVVIVERTWQFVSKSDFPKHLPFSPEPSVKNKPQLFYKQNCYH